MLTRTASVVLFLALAAGSALAQVNPAAATKVDPRVQIAVQSIGYEYVVEGSTVVVLIPVSPDRDRPVFVESKTQYQGLTEVRLMFSIARIYEGDVPAEVMEFLQGVNKELKTGQFVVLEGANGKHIVAFALLVDAEANAQDLKGCIDGVCAVTAKMSDLLAKVS